MKKISVTALAIIVGMSLTACGELNAFQKARIAECEALIRDNLMGGWMGYESMSFTDQKFEDAGSGNGVITGTYSGDGGMLAASAAAAGNYDGYPFQCSVSGNDVSLDFN